jgi:hypothetical protein
MIELFKLITIFTGICRKKICNRCILFIGPMPIGLSRKNLKTINKKDYAILEKSDGVRYIISIVRSNFFFISRENKISNYKSVFSKSKKEIYEIDYTFIDGELVKNLLNQKFQYLNYDLISFLTDWRISTWDFLTRLQAGYIVLKMSKNEIFQSKNSLFTKKDVFLKSEIVNVLDKISKNKSTYTHVYYNKNRTDKIICNRNDGLVFTHINCPYFSKNCLNFLKWKYFTANTVDLDNTEIFSNLKSDGVCKQLYLSCFGFGRNSFLLDLSRESIFDFDKFSNFTKFKTACINEYAYNRFIGKWIFNKKRHEKLKPNSFRVLLNTIEMICDLLSKEEIVDKTIKSIVKNQRGKFVNNF